jgi:hypothetical protein
MPTRPTHQTPLPLAVAALLTFGFVGCLSETRSLNGEPAGNGGEEGEQPAAGTGGKAAAAGTGSGSHAGNSSMGTGGRSETGGSSGAGPRGGSSFAGSSAFAGVPNGGSAGSPNGGVPNGGVGAMAGYAGGLSGSGPVAGSAGGAGAPSCVVGSDVSTCGGQDFCVDHALDACAPDYESECSGSCAAPYLAPVCSGFGAVECPRDFECLPDPDTAQGTDPTSFCVGGRSPECSVSTPCADGFSCLGTPDGARCVPDRADCIPNDICDSGIPKCPPGYAPANARICDYVCVPFQHCGCEKDIDCPQPSVCDREDGRCLVPLAPAPRCEEPFDAGPCDAAVPVYAFVDGECKAQVYGGCEGNGNRFSTLEECVSSCQGMPLEESCRGSRKAALGCLGCGAGGGCTLWGQFCFEPCESNDDCPAQGGYACTGGICQIGPCV